MRFVPYQPSGSIHHYWISVQRDTLVILGEQGLNSFTNTKNQHAFYLLCLSFHGILVLISLSVNYVHAANGGCIGLAHLSPGEWKIPPRSPTSRLCCVCQFRPASPTPVCQCRSKSAAAPGAYFASPVALFRHCQESWPLSDWAAGAQLRVPRPSADQLSSQR